MNINKLLVIFLILAMTVPINAHAKILLSEQMIKATWLQSIELLKTNRAAQIIAGVAVGAIGTSGFLLYKVLQLSKEKKRLQENEKNNYTKVIPAVIDAMTINIDQPVGALIHQIPVFSNLSNSHKPLLYNQIVTGRHDLFQIIKEATKMRIKDAAETSYSEYNHSTDPDFSGYGASIKKHATPERWNEILLGASSATSLSTKKQ
jgi:hypothetical protein